MQLSESFDDGDALFQAAEDQGFEGILAKRARSTYQPGRRSRDWVKVKTHGNDEFVVGGYTKGEGRRASTFGSLLLGEYDEQGTLGYVGSVGTGFDDREIGRLLKLLRPLATSTPPFDPVPKPPRVRKGDIVWVEPKLVAQVEFAERTHDNRLRAPSYQGLREDKEAEEVRAEEEPLPTELRKGKRVLKLSNLDKTFFPVERITKGDLLAYYRAVAPVARPAPEGPALHHGRLSRRDRGQALLPEGRALAHAGVDPAPSRARSRRASRRDAGSGSSSRSWTTSSRSSGW